VGFEKLSTPRRRGSVGIGLAVAGDDEGTRTSMRKMLTERPGSRMEQKHVTGKPLLQVRRKGFWSGMNAQIEKQHPSPSPKQGEHDLPKNNSRRGQFRALAKGSDIRK